MNMLMYIFYLLLFIFVFECLINDLNLLNSRSKIKYHEIKLWLHGGMFSIIKSWFNLLILL